MPNSDHLQQIGKYSRLSRHGVLLFFSISLMAVSAPVFASVKEGDAGVPSQETATVIVITGAEGEPEFGERFAQWSANWEKAARAAGANFIQIGRSEADASKTDFEQIRQAIEKQPSETQAELWIVLNGHGTFDGREAKFNLRGPDLSASDLAEWLQPFNRPLAVINASSSSAPFINKLSAPGRVTVTATRSGAELNYARFGKFLSEAINSLGADLDKDGQVSLLEAFLTASHRTQEFYKTDGRLATEHALIDDNGDGLGTPADWFRGVRAVKKADKGVSLDGHRAHQFHLIRSEQERRMPSELRARRDELELQVIQLREAKSGMEEDAYYAQLEKLLLELARLYEKSNGKAPTPAAP